MQPNTQLRIMCADRNANALFNMNFKSAIDRRETTSMFGSVDMINVRWMHIECELNVFGLQTFLNPVRV